MQILISQATRKRRKKCDTVLHKCEKGLNCMFSKDITIKMSMQLNYSDVRGVIQIDLSPSLPDRSAASSKNEIEYPKFDTVNSRFAQYDVFGGKRSENIMAPSEKSEGRVGPVEWDSDAEDGQQTRSLFSRSRYNSVEEELANIPYAFASNRTQPHTQDSISNINTKSNLNTSKPTVFPRTFYTEKRESPDKDLEDDRFFNKNRATKFKLENSLFGPEISYDNILTRDSVRENDNSNEETIAPAFSVKQLIHAQDRYYDLSSKQSSIVNNNKNDLNIPKKVTLEKAASTKKDSSNKTVKKVGDVKTLTSERTKKVVKISDSKVKSPVSRVPGRTDKNVEAFRLLSHDRKELPSGAVEPSQNPHKVLPISKRNREHSFAIIAERSPNSSRPQSPAAAKESRSGRVSPLKGRGFREHISQTNPRNSRANSPNRFRTNSLTEVDIMAQTIVPHQPILNLERPLTPKNYIKANMDEVHDISEFNRERNLELAEQKRLEEEEAILIEMGILEKSNSPKNARSRSTSRASSPNKFNLRSRSNSPSAVLQYEPIPKNSKDYINTEDRLRKPTQKSRTNSMSKSQPHSKTGSPKHFSKIPKRQNSVSPTRGDVSAGKGSFSKKEPFGINRQSRFISNSTSSINESARILPDVAGSKGGSKSTQNLGITPSLLKNKPPKSPGKFGPPPTNRNVNSKRLSPIVGTPNKNSNENTPTRHTGSTQKSTAPKTTSRSTKVLPLNTGLSKQNHIKPSSKSVSKSLSRETSPDKNLKSTMNVTKNSTQSGSQIDLFGASNKTIKSVPLPLKKTASKLNINSRPPVANKPDMKNNVSRTNSTKSLSKTNSNKNLLDQLNLKKTDSLKSIKSNKDKQKKDAGEGELGSDNNTIITNSSTMKSFTAEISKNQELITSSEGVSTQDGETQYDKSNTATDTSGGKLIPLTKHNVVSMTTAAITSQPLEVAAKVTGQLPAAFEKAKEKGIGIFEKKSSNDSIVEKIGNKEETQKKRNSVLEKKSSKSSLGSVKEGNLIFSSPVVDENIKLKPLHPPLDPQIEKVKRKIDSILNAPEVGTEDISAIANNMTNEAESDAIEAAKDVSQTIDKYKSDVTEIAKEEGHKAVIEITAAQNELNKKLDNILTPIDNLLSNNLTSKSEPKNNNIEPVVTIVNNKKPILVSEANERSTEKLVTGSPDIEVQSSNMSSSTSKMTKNNKEKQDPISSNGGFPKSTSTTGNQAQSSKGLLLPEKTLNRGSISSNPLPSKKDETKPANICQRFVGRCINTVPCCGKIPCCNKTALDEAKVIDEKIDKKKKEGKKSLENAVKEKAPGLVSKLNCCKKNEKKIEEKNQADIQNERLKSTEIGNMAGSKKNDKEPGRLGKLFSCCACCRGKNKINDSNGDMEMSLEEKKVGCCSRLWCCKSDKAKQQDWASRRDSILSEPAPKRCCGKCRFLFCCLPCSPCCKTAAPETSDLSRRPSMFSKNKSLSPTIPPEDTRPKLDPSLVEHTSHMRGAVPALPLPLAWFCLVCNVLVPGFGTVMSGLLCLCFGKPRFSVHDGPKPRLGSFVINLVVGAAQLFTVLFCLVGWGWSIWWGIIMIKVARKYKKLKQSQAADPERGNVPPVTSTNHTAP